MVQAHEALGVQDTLTRQHFTQGPPHYTEAQLVKTLQERGIGRPSTYAPIISVLQVTPLATGWRGPHAVMSVSMDSRACLTLICLNGRQGPS